MLIFPSRSVRIPPDGPTPFPGLGVSYLDEILSLLGSGVIQYLPGDDLSGTTARDASARGNVGTYLGSPTLGNVGMGDGRTSADMRASAVIKGESAGLIPLWSETAGYMMCWIAYNDGSYWADANQYVLSRSECDATHYYMLRNNVDGSLVLYSRRGATILQIQPDPPTTARWAHFAIVWDNANDRLACHINGTKQIPATGMGTLGGLALSLARWGGISNTTAPINGRIAHMILGNVVPLDSQIIGVSQSVGQVIYEGDSRTALKRWPAAATEMAFPSGEFAFGKYGQAFYAVSGSTTTTMAARQSTVNALIRAGQKNILVVWCGVNDSGTAAQIYANLSAYCTNARAAGYKVVLCTEIDAAPAGWTAKYQALNALIYADHSFADGLADLGARAELQDHTNATYFTDGTHLTVAGYNVVRDVVYPVIAAL